MHLDPYQSLKDELICTAYGTHFQVWDRRTLQNDDCQAVGILAGHNEGITHLDSRNDGRYVISNCKDDTIRLWDLRKMRSSQQ